MLRLKGIRWIVVVGLALALALGGLKMAVASGSLLPNWAPQNSILSQTTPAEVRGTARVGDTVRVFQGDTLIGETIAGQDGAWRVAVPQLASRPTPFRVQIIPPAQRGGVEDPDGERVTILVSVIVGANRVDVRVLVSSPNGEVEIEVSAPIEPAPCDSEKPAQPTATYHTVRFGETLSKIAAKYGVTASAIAQANNLRNVNLIFPGQRLLIPAR